MSSPCPSLFLTRISFSTDTDPAGSTALPATVPARGGMLVNGEVLQKREGDKSREAHKSQQRRVQRLNPK
jgi:hypothetical protein